MRSNYLWIIAAAAFYFSSSSCVNAQMPGMGGMGGMGRGMGRGNNDSNQEPDKPPPPPTKVNPFAPDAMPVDGAKEKTDAMERFIFGHVQSGQKLDKRVARLEKRLVPYEHHKGKEDLQQRVDHLWTIMANANGSTGTGKREQSEKPDKDDKKLN
jgi:hypothetical protein